MKRIQSFRAKLIVCDPESFRPEETHIISVDGVNIITQEFRLNLSTGLFDHKSHSCDMKYEFVIAVWQPKCVWINDPCPAGKHHDKSFFWGAENMDSLMHTWDRDALLFNP